MSLRYPNEDTPADGFIRSMIKDFLIHDNAYAVLAPAADERITLVRIPAYMIVVQGHSLFSVDNYRIWPQGAWTSIGSWGGQGTWIDVAPEAMLHWHGEHPEDPRIGLSHLDTLQGRDRGGRRASAGLRGVGECRVAGADVDLPPLGGAEVEQCGRGWVRGDDREQDAIPEPPAVP